MSRSTCYLQAQLAFCWSSTISEGVVLLKLPVVQAPLSQQHTEGAHTLLS